MNVLDIVYKTMQETIEIRIKNKEQGIIDEEMPKKRH